MVIKYENNKIKRICNKASGKLKRRLDDIDASDNMEILISLPGRCHALKANRKGQWAIDLEHPKRLIFEPKEDPLPISNDGFLNLKKIDTIKIIEVCDYHE